ncbi:hypothetical protein ACWDTP_26795 [Mycobacterium sp. NPDC003449]
MNRWLQQAALSSGSRHVRVQSPRRVFADASSLVRRRYVDLLLVNSCLCSR